MNENLLSMFNTKPDIDTHLERNYQLHSRATLTQTFWLFSLVNCGF